MITRNFNLNLYAGNSSPLVINVNQYDSGEQWVFTLYDENGVQYIPSTGAIVGIKSDGLGIINTGSVVDGKVVINETQQMTAAIGKATFELMLDSQTHGTANFVVLVEPKPGDNASLSESDLSLLQEAIDATSPLPTGGTVGQVLTKTANGSAWSDAGTPTQEQVAEAVSDWADENITVETGVVIDQSLSVSGAAADAKKTGDEISDLKSQISDIEEQIEGGTGSGLTEDIKQALLQFAQNVAYANEDGQTYYDALHNALYAISAITLNANSISLQTIGVTQQLTATTTPVGGTVAWSSSDTNVVTVSNTGLVTSIGYGSAIITASAGSVSATCNVLVAQATVTSISAVYTQTKEVYPTDSLDKLESDLVVTANWSDSTTSTITSADYALSGTLEVGTSTITVSYAGKTTTFNVSVTIEVIPRTFYFAPTEDVKSGQMINDQGQAVANTNSSFVDKFVECFASATLSDSLGFSAAANRTAFYDADHAFLSRGWKGGGANTEKTLSNANASYAKLGWQIDGGVSPNYLLAIGKMEEFTISGKALNGSTGELSDSSDGDSATDYIEVDSSATKFILFTDISATDSATLNKYVLRIVFYDNNKNRISYFNTYANGKAYIGDIPSNASYFRASAPTEQMNCGFPIMLEH